MTTYLDHASTSPVRPEVLEAMMPYLSGGTSAVFGNPSSSHETGERAARALAAARERVAAAFGCRPGEVVFTSGGTEAINLAVRGIALASPRGRNLVTTTIEHEAVRESADALVRLHGFDLDLVGVTSEGLVDPNALAAAVRPHTTLVSIQHASHEFGTIQPVAALADVVRAAGARLHVDAVQSAAHLPIDLAQLGADAISIAGHKLGAPKGTGALVVRRGVRLEPLHYGGGQERGRRAGTEDVAGAVALAAGLELAADDRRRGAALVDARDALIAGVLSGIPGAFLTGAAGSRRLPGHISFCVTGINGETLLLELERDGFVASSGSACSAGSGEPSRALLALGLDEQAALSALRLGLPGHATIDDAEHIVAAIVRAVATVRGLAGAAR